MRIRCVYSGEEGLVPKGGLELIASSKLLLTQSVLASAHFCVPNCVPLYSTSNLLSQ
jgi:hypothetical protein